VAFALKQFKCLPQQGMLPEPGARQLCYKSLKSTATFIRAVDFFCKTLSERNSRYFRLNPY
jgi:hypothetical protein